MLGPGQRGQPGGSARRSASGGYTGSSRLSAEILLDALAEVQRERELAPDEAPDLARRDWSSAAEQHVGGLTARIALPAVALRPLTPVP